MADKKTSPKVATLAAKVLDGSKKPSPKEVKALAASDLSQARGKKGK